MDLMDLMDGVDLVDGRRGVLGGRFEAPRGRRRPAGSMRLTRWREALEGHVYLMNLDVCEENTYIIKQRGN